MIDDVGRLVRDVGRKGFFHLLSANFLIGFMGFASQLVIARLVSPDELGEIKAMQSFVAVAVVLGGFGFNTSVLKMCSEKRSPREKAALFSRNVTYSIVPVVITLVIVSILAKVKLLSPDTMIDKWLPYYALVIPALVCTSLVMAYLQALKRIQLMAKWQVIIRIIGLLGMVALTYLYGLTGFIVATIATGYVAIFPLVLLVRDDIRTRSKIVGLFRTSFYYARWSAAGNGISIVGQYMDIFVLNYFMKDRTTFGFYSLATIFILGMNYVTMTAQSIATPYFSEKSDDRKEFVRVLRKYEKVMMLLAAATSLIAVFIVPVFIEAFYGPKYSLASTCFRILVMKYLFWSFYALLGVAVLGLGKMKFNFLAHSIVVPVSFGLTYLFVVREGPVGAAIGQASAYFLAMIIVAIMTKTVVKRHFDALEVLNA